MSERKIDSYSFEDLCALAKDFKTQVEEISLVRHSSEPEFNDGDTFSVVMGGKIYSNGIKLSMKLKLNSEIADLKVLGALEIELNEGWRISKDDFDKCCQLLVAPALFPLVRSAAANALSSAGLSSSAIPSQISPFNAVSIEVNANFIEYEQRAGECG